MKYYKLKENDLIIYNLEKIITQKDRENYKGGYFDYVGTIENSLCKSIEALKKEIYEWSFKYEIDEEDKNEVLNAYKLIEEIISRAGIEEYEVIYPNVPGIIVEIRQLDDQYECDADRTPKLFLKSLTELEKINLEMEFYEIYSIDEQGKFKFEQKFSTYRFLDCEEYE
jgi:hypothetical protein